MPLEAKLLATDHWQRAATLPISRSGVGAVAHEGCIYVFGGVTFTGSGGPSAP
jgi:hypothetical protein